jgi:hypothetical protein
MMRQCQQLSIVIPLDEKAIDSLNAIWKDAARLTHVTLTGLPGCHLPYIPIPYTIANISSSLQHLWLHSIHIPASTGRRPGRHGVNVKQWTLPHLPSLLTLEINNCYLGGLLTASSLQSIRLLNTCIEGTVDMTASTLLHSIHILWKQNAPAITEDITRWRWPSSLSVLNDVVILGSNGVKRSFLPLLSLSLPRLQSITLISILTLPSYFQLVSRLRHHYQQCHQSVI